MHPRMVEGKGARVLVSGELVFPSWLQPCLSVDVCRGPGDRQGCQRVAGRDSPTPP